MEPKDNPHIKPEAGRAKIPLQRIVMQWIDVDTALPPHSKKVIAIYKNSHGNKRTITAERILAFTEECRCEHDDCGCEYSDLKDEYYFPAGWYEVCENHWDGAFICPVVDGKITHWMPLPPEPGHQLKHDCRLNVDVAGKCFICGTTVQA